MGAAAGRDFNNSKMVRNGEAHPSIGHRIAEIENMYPFRILPAGALVTRVGPSPTGPMHIGGVYTALLSRLLAKQSGGIFFLRIEDTDRSREMAGATELIHESLEYFGLKPDEDENIGGDYAPYRQSERGEIYRAYADELLNTGKAYFCFCTPEELAEIAEEQQKNGERPGYYGKYARWRDADEDDIGAALEAGLPFVVRFRSPATENEMVSYEDLVLGEREIPANDLDSVLLKSDDMPTYHFAHVVDDHLMGTTTVIRGNEWVSSVPLHLQLFDALGWTAPEYGHVAPIMKQDGGSRRKLSKRRDPEASVEYYMEKGIPAVAVEEYLLGIADSGFEPWRAENPNLPLENYPLDKHNIGHGAGALLDLDKLTNISQEVISRMNAVDIRREFESWGSKNTDELFSEAKDFPVYLENVISIERDRDNSRKDFSSWSDVSAKLGFFFDGYFNRNLVPKITMNEVRGNIDSGTAHVIAHEVADGFRDFETNDEWMEFLREVAAKNGLAGSMKEYKQNRENYRGHIGDAARIVRVLLCGENRSPDLFQVMQVMGKSRVLKRLEKANDL